jgi:hypothetical protein
MKTLKESILADIDDALKQGDIAIEEVGTFGGKYKLYNIDYPYRRPGFINRYLNSAVLKSLTKDIKKYDPNIDTATDEFDKQDTVKMFLKWFNTVKLTELGDLANGNVYKLSEYIMKTFGKYSILKKDGLKVRVLLFDKNLTIHLGTVNNRHVFTNDLVLRYVSK